MHGGADDLTCHKASTMFSGYAGDLCTLKIWEGFYHELHHEPEKEGVFNYCIDWMKRQL
jgi:alpha-beta hydrolase superfamily lysophospholipase